MKRVLSLILALFCAAALMSGCGAERSVAINAIIYEISGDRLTAVAGDGNSREAMGGDYFFVNCGSAEISNSGGSITVADLCLGDKIGIVWDGTILLSYPQQIEADAITVTSEEPQELFFNEDGSLWTRLFKKDGYPETSDLDAETYETSTLKPLEITCDFLESDIATAELACIAYRDSCITGEITITDNTPYEYGEEQAFIDEMREYIDSAYIITWHCGDSADEIYSNSHGVEVTEEGAFVIYTKGFKEYITAEEKDRTVEISITGLNGSLSFTIPGEK